MSDFAEIENILSGKLNIYNHGRYEEIVQPLADLGYITVSEKEGLIVEDDELKRGIERFRQESLEAGLLAPSDFLPGQFPDMSKEDLLSSKELNLLQLLTGLDGDFVLQQLPEFPVVTISSRVFHYRLHLLGLYDYPVDRPFSVLSQKAWKQLQMWFGELSESELLCLTGDFNDFAYRIKDCVSVRNCLIYFKYKPVKFDANLYTVFQNEGFSSQVKKNIDRKSEEYKNYKKKVCSKHPDFDFIEKKCNSELNCFLVRIVQLNQWISGYYLGTIDNDFGELSFNSLLDIVKNENENGNIDFKAYNFIGYIDRDYWVVNINYLFDGLKAPSKLEADYKKLFTSYQDTLEKFTPEEQEQFTTNMNLAWEGINRSMHNNMKSGRFRFRRVYLGAKNMICSMIRNIGLFLKNIASTAWSALGFLKNKMMNLSKLLFREIREGAIHFKKGLWFLFDGNITTEKEGTRIHSHFDFDCDSILTIEGELNKQIEEKHATIVDQTVKDLKLSLAITGRIIDFILMSATLNWPALVVKLGITFKNGIGETLKSKSGNRYALIVNF